MSVVPALLAAIVLAVSFHPAVYRRIARWRMPLAIAAYIITRPVLFVIIYIVLGNRHIEGDIQWYQQVGLGVLSGNVPYRDFTCYYSPLFPYLMAVPYGIWHHISSSIMLFIVFDLACLVLLCKLTRMTLGARYVQDIAWIWVVNPVVWIITVRYGQDEPLIAAFLLFAVYLYMKGSRWWNPTVLALGILMTKFTTAIGMMVIYSYSRAKIRDAIVVAVLIAAVCAPFYLSGADLLMPVHGQKASLEGASITALAGKLFVADGHAWIALERVGTVVTLLALGLAIYAMHRRKLSILDGLIVGLLVFLIFSPVSYKFYRLWLLGPLSIYALKTNRVGRLALYSGLLCAFDDFSLDRAAGHPAIFYAAVVLGVLVLLMEITYVRQILTRKPLASPMV